MGNRQPESFLFHRNECPALPGGRRGRDRRKNGEEWEGGREGNGRRQRNVTKKQLLVVCVAKIRKPNTEIRSKDFEA